MLSFIATVTNQEVFQFYIRLKARNHFSSIILNKLMTKKCWERTPSVSTKMKWSVRLTCGRKTIVYKRLSLLKVRKSKWGRIEVILPETWKLKFLLVVEDLECNILSRFHSQYLKERKSCLSSSVAPTSTATHFQDLLILVFKCLQMMKKQENFHLKR